MSAAVALGMTTAPVVVLHEVAALIAPFFVKLLRACATSLDFGRYPRMNEVADPNAT